MDIILLSHFGVLITRSHDLPTQQMTLWVTKEILTQENIKQRCAIIQRMLDICKICLKLNNYVTVFQITSALISTPVQRLRKTWDHLPLSVRKPKYCSD